MPHSNAEPIGAAQRPSAAVDREETAEVQRRYDRIAPFYDLIQWLFELRARRWRRDLVSRIEGSRILEVGVGTGKNFSYYPADRDIAAVDLSENMLARARRRAARAHLPVHLQQADAEALTYRDASFDTVLATLVFCSVPDPVRGLEEARRVLVPGGQLLLLEHVGTHRRWLHRLLHWLAPVLARGGEHVERDTVGSVRRAGFVDVVETDLWLDVVKRIEAVAP